MPKNKCHQRPPYQPCATTDLLGHQRNLFDKKLNQKELCATRRCKGSFEWETIAKYLIALVILLVLIVLIGLFKDKLLNAFESMKVVFGNG